MQLLGVHGVKEYYLDDHGKVFYRVPAVREAIRAQPGWKLVISDFSQIEVKIMAFLSQDPWLITAINSGKDMHCFMAADCSDGLYPYELLYAAKSGKLPELYGGQILLANGQPYKGPRYAEDELIALRSDIKTVTFGLPYGAGPDTVAEMIQKRDKRTGVPIEPIDAAKMRAEDLINRYFAKAKVLQRFLKNQGESALRFGLSRSPRGRIRWYTLPEPGDEDANKRRSQIRRFAGNQPIQGGNVDLLKPAVAHYYRSLRGGVVNGPRVCDARILLVVHDEIVATAPEDQAQTAADKLAESMTWAYQQIELRFGPVIHRLDEIFNRVTVLQADYWVKD